MRRCRIFNAVEKEREGFPVSPPRDLYSRCGWTGEGFQGVQVAHLVLIERDRHRVCVPYASFSLFPPTKIMLLINCIYVLLNVISILFCMTKLPFPSRFILLQSARQPTARDQEARSVFSSSARSFVSCSMVPTGFGDALLLIRPVTEADPPRGVMPSAPSGILRTCNNR